MVERSRFHNAAIVGPEKDNGFFMSTPWYGEGDKLLDVAIRLAEIDGKELPDKDSLRRNSFLGTDNYWIKDKNDTPLHKIPVKRIKKYLDNSEASIGVEHLTEERWDKPTCQTCRFWDPSGLSGICRRYPKQGGSEWTVTHMLDWCGEHALKGEAKGR